MSTTAGQFLVSVLEASGVDRVFCVPGESYLPVLDALFDSKIDVVTCHHESSAGFMALADARLTGVPGICFVSRGPGATNAAIAVHTAQQDAVPFILFVGQVSRANLRRGAFQEIDYAKMYGDIAKWVAEVTDPVQLAEVLARALHVASNGAPGPVIVSLPEDILDEAVPDAAIRAVERTKTAPDRAVIDETAVLLRSAARPLIVAGGELATDAGRRALLEAATAFSVPVAVSFRRHDVFPNDHPLFAGELGIFNSPPQLDALKSADLVMAVGTRLNDLTTQGFTFLASPWPRQKFVHVYDDPSVIGTHFAPDIGVASSGASFLAGLARSGATTADPDRKKWIERLHTLQVGLSTWHPKTAEDGVVFGNVLASLRTRVKDDAIIVLDAGISAALTYRYFPFRPPMRLMATIAGVMGFGVPGAVAAAMRCPGRQIVCIVGDGGFLMTGNELLIAVQRKLPLCVVVANNRSLGTIRVHQERMFPGRTIGTDLSPPDFAALAKSFGCASLTIDREQDIASALDGALETPGPVLIEVKTSLSVALPGAGGLRANVRDQPNVHRI